MTRAINKRVYEQDILRSDRAGELDELRVTVLADDSLTGDEKDELTKLIHHKIVNLLRRPH